MTTAAEYVTFEPEEFIGREPEKRLFEELLSDEYPARVMMIQDGGGRGKSQLMHALRFRCQFGTPPVPVGLVAVDDLQPKTPYRFVRTVETKLFDDFGLRFTRFRDLEDEQYDRPATGARLVSGEVDVGTQGGGQATGANVTFNAPVTVYGGDDPDRLETFRRRAVDAFVNDLRDVCGEGPVVLMIDAYEDSGQELDEWIQRLVRDHVVAAEGAVERLRVVIAGQRVPHKPVEFHLRQRFTELIHHVDSLSDITLDEARALLDLHEVKGYEERDVAYVRDLINAGRPILKIVTGIRVFIDGPAR